MLFDKYERPNLSDLSESEAWEACNAFESWFWENAEGMDSDEEYDCALEAVRSYRDEYYRIFE